jgi:prophage regulatory protein
MAIEFLSAADLKRRGINFSTTQLWRKMAAGTFPKSVKLGGRTQAWVKDEVDAWSESLLQERDDAA